ncbi:MAG: putative PEP-binding protein, partial [Clostridia bacterium]
MAICGEMASDRMALKLLLGLGLDSFSMTPVWIPEIKERILNISLEKCRKVANEAMAMDNVADIRDF